MTDEDRFLAIRKIMDNCGGDVMSSEAALQAIRGVLAPTPSERKKGTSIIMLCDCPQKDYGLHDFYCPAVEELFWRYPLPKGTLWKSPNSTPSTPS